MAKIEQFCKVKGYKYRGVDRFRNYHLFKSYRDALVWYLAQ